MKQKINSLVKIILFFTVAFLGSTIYANATSITTSASGSFFDDAYGYTFTIEDSVDPAVYQAVLTNTSDTSLADALIDGLAFNMNATLGTDFSITNVNPLWTFAAATGGIQFDYVGDRTTPATRLSPGDLLTFDFVFDSSYTLPTDPFSVWTGTDESLGTGLGGGTDSGQVAVSFQQLGASGEDSDLLASNWENGGGGGGGGGDPIPEPATFMLFGIGLLGLARVSRRNK